MTDSPRTDAHYGRLPNDRQTRGLQQDYEHAADLERDLAAMELRAMDCVALNERQAINFAKCQAELAVALGLLREVRDRWYSMTPYSCLKMDIDALLDAPDAARREVKKVCDYARLPHSGGGTDHGQVAHSKGGYNICVKCYDAIIEAEKRESAHYDAARREHEK